MGKLHHLANGETRMDYTQPHALSLKTGAMLRAARKERRWTLAKAGDEIGCHFSHLSRMETAQAAPSTALAGDIARAYQLGTEEVIALMGEAVVNAGRSKPRRKAAAKEATGGLRE